MSPLEPERQDGLANEPCRALTFDGDVAVCCVYKKRPAQCRSHEYPFKFCPVGMEVLGLSREQAASRVQRLDFMEYIQDKGASK